MEAKHYVIRGGIEGRERLRILARVMRDGSAGLIDRLGLRDGMACLDVGCGGGDVTVELARRVAPSGRVIGWDIDGTKLDLARTEARALGIDNVTFALTDVHQAAAGGSFDAVYARFLLTHLHDPERTIAAFAEQLRPGGMLAVEDIDFRGHFSDPECPAFRRYLELYCATVHKRGGDPNIGPRLPRMLRRCGFEDVGMHVVQPAALQGETTLIAPITLANIAPAVLEDGLASQDEIDDLVRELDQFAADPNTVISLPRIVQTWGRRPEA